MNHLNYNILHHLLYQPIKLMLLFLTQAQVSWLKRNLSKQEALPWPFSNSNKVFCCYTVLQTQDRLVYYLLCYGKGAPSPCLGAPDSWRPSCGAERERRSHESFHQPAFSSVGRVAQDEQRRSFSGHRLQFLHWWTLQVESSHLTRLRVLTLWASQDRRTPILCSEFSRSLTTE